MQKKSTYTPWEFLFQPREDHVAAIQTVVEGDKFPETICELNNKANARHIVKCVNMHDELLEALEFAVLIAEGEIHGNWDDVMKYRETLKKAEE